MDDANLEKLLWELYSHGKAELRERIEGPEPGSLARAAPPIFPARRSPGPDLSDREPPRPGRPGDGSLPGKPLPRRRADGSAAFPGDWDRHAGMADRDPPPELPTVSFEKKWTQSLLRPTGEKEVHPCIWEYFTSRCVRPDFPPGTWTWRPAPPGLAGGGRETAGLWPRAVMA